jgi:hypothetical protein
MAWRGGDDGAKLQGGGIRGAKETTLRGWVWGVLIKLNWTRVYFYEDEGFLQKMTCGVTTHTKKSREVEKIFRVDIKLSRIERSTIMLCTYHRY